MGIDRMRDMHCMGWPEEATIAMRKDIKKRKKKGNEITLEISRAVQALGVSFIEEGMGGRS